MSNKTRSEITQYGFNYGSAKITRIHTSKDGSVFVGLKTPRTRGIMQIYVTKTGKVRVFGADSREWLPK